MSRKTIIILAIIIQLAVLVSFGVRYEILGRTGTTLYIPLRGYDPTDILRGDYVNLSYELPYSGSTEGYSSEQQYLIPIIDSTTITGIKQITTTRPEYGIYFQIRNGWMQNTTQKYTIRNKSGKQETITGELCQKEWKIGDEVLYMSGQVQSIREITPEERDNSTWQWWLVGTLISQSTCSGNYRFQTTATDRWFVREWTGHDIEKQIRDGKMYGEWKVGNNGAVIITDIVAKEKLPK
jgi:uncharacterized membrane-anchored protein